MSTSIRKRSGSGSSGSSGSNKKAPMKEKIVQMYDVLLKESDGQIIIIQEAEQFWSEFFLLKPKIGHLESELMKMNVEQVAAARANINQLFEQSLANLSEQHHHIRVVYALQTLCGLVRAAYRKGGGVDIVNLLMGFELAEKQMHCLITHVNEFLTGEEPASLKDLCLKLLLIIATGMDNVSQNTLMEYIMMGSIFESLVHLLSLPEARSVHGHNAVLLMALLVQYRKYYESTSNPYVVKLSILDEELSLHGYGQVITSSLAAYTSSYEASLQDQQPSSGWFSSITSMVGNMFVSDEGGVRVEQMRARNCVLLALYEAVHLNRHFIATLGHYQTTSTETTREANSAPATPTASPADQNFENSDVNPSNLLVTFLEYCSIVMQDTKSDSSLNTVKLSFLILVCVTEDQYANALMHDQNLVFHVKLHKAPMRHRKMTSSSTPMELNCPSRSLACAVMDLMVEFIRSHLMKRFPHELYTHSLSVIHRLLAYQKRFRVRVQYPWKDLWTALISLIKFVATNESNLVKKMNIFAVALQVTVLFNLFITYGDTFLPSPSSYDELYYELVRCHATFDALYSMSLRYSTGGGEYKETAVRVTNALVNIRAITAHFNPKIDAWLSSQQLSTPTEDEILEVVKSNYDSLTLKLQDGLDQYERYTESPKHSSFFTTLVRSVVSDSRQHIVLNDLELQLVLQDFSTIQ